MYVDLNWIILCEKQWVCAILNFECSEILHVFLLFSVHLGLGLIAVLQLRSLCSGNQTVPLYS